MANSNNHNSKKREQTAARIIKAIAESQGLLTVTAKKAGISYWTVCRYANEYPSVKAAVIEAKERLLDFAEGKLMEQMHKGNMTAIIFYLKTQGKARGFTERQEITGEGGKPLSVNITVESEAAKVLTQKIVNGERTESQTSSA